VLAADEELAQANLELLESQSRFHLFLLELERLTGQPLALSGPVPLPAMEHK
jgi:cobalt-zinc-cadmium efflux system outer membrane protein